MPSKDSDQASVGGWSTTVRAADRFLLKTVFSELEGLSGDEVGSFQEDKRQL